MATLDVFRSTVGAAALGFARRALHETVERAATRKLFGAPLGELQMTQATIADSATDVDASALLVYRAAWTKDQGAARVTREAAMAKMVATEAAQRVIDRAVQLHRRPRRHQGRQGRGALPRDPRAADLRGRDRGAEDRDRARAVEEPAREIGARGGVVAMVPRMTYSHRHPEVLAVFGEPRRATARMSPHGEQAATAGAVHPSRPAKTRAPQDDGS